MANEFYIITTNHKAIWPRGVLLFWGPDSKGYSTTLEMAGKYTKERAEKIQGYHGGDYMVPCDVIDAAAVRVVDIDKLSEFVPSIGGESL